MHTHILTAGTWMYIDVLVKAPLINNYKYYCIMYEK